MSSNPKYTWNNQDDIKWTLSCDWSSKWDPSKCWRGNRQHLILLNGKTVRTNITGGDPSSLSILIPFSFLSLYLSFSQAIVVLLQVRKPWISLPFVWLLCKKKKRRKMKESTIKCFNLNFELFFWATEKSRRSLPNWDCYRLQHGTRYVEF